MLRVLILILILFVGCVEQTYSAPSANDGPDKLANYKNLYEIAVRHLQDNSMAEAENYFRKALFEIRRQDKDSDNELATLARLADVCLKRRKEKKAEFYYDQIVKLHEKKRTDKTLGRESTDWIDGLSYTFRKYKTRTVDQRRKYYNHALVLKEMAGGDKGMVELLRELTNFCFATQDYKKAEQYATRLVKLDQKNLGFERVEVAQEIAVLARAKQKLGKYDEAESFFRQAIAIFSSKEKAAPILIPSLKAELARCLFEGKQYELAKKEAEEAFVLLKRDIGAYDPSTVGTRQVLADLYMIDKNYKAVIVQRELIIKITDKKYGTNNPLNLNDMRSLLKAYRMTGQKGKAKALKEKISYIETLVPRPQVTIQKTRKSN